MIMQSYKDVIWSNQTPPDAYNNNAHDYVLGVAGLSAMGAAGVYAGSKPVFNGYSAMDYMAAGSRTVGNLSPFEILNTFRVPEFLSPFLSEKFRSPTSNVGYNFWTREQLSNSSTYEWLKYTVGLSDTQLRERGIVRGMGQEGGLLARGLAWERHAGSYGRGSLYSLVENGSSVQKILLSDSVAIGTAGKETIPIIGERTGRINQWLRGIFSAADMYDKFADFNEEAVGSSVQRIGDKLTYDKSEYLFFPSPTGPIRNVADLGRRTTYLRGMSAFNMLRFNNILKDLSRYAGGDFGEKFFKKTLGFVPEVGNATASKMFFRFGGKAAAVAGIGLGVSQLDWMREEYGMPGQLVASTTTSAGIMYGLKNLTGSGKTAAIIGGLSLAGQMVLPGFDKGLVEGIATTGVNASVLRGNSLNLFNYYRRTLEGFLPGVSDFETGALIGIGAAASMYIRSPKSGLHISTEIADKLGIIPNTIDIEDINMHKSSIRDIFYERIGSQKGLDVSKPLGLMQRLSLLSDTGGKTLIEHTKDLNTEWQIATDVHDQLRRTNPINKALMEDLKQLDIKTTGASRFTRELLAGLSTMRYSYLGADISKDSRMLNEIGEMGFSIAKRSGSLGKTLSIGFGAFALHGLVTGRFLGSMEDASQLSDIYSGRELVEVKKSRFWEAGGTPFEGSESSYYRPHMYHLLMTDAVSATDWGSYDDKSPIEKLFIRNFTYDIERDQYWDRPYPISSAAFSDIPVIGDIVGSTIGSVVKPRRIMHSSEWIREGGDSLEYADIYRGNHVEPAYSLGAIGTGVPTTASSGEALLSNTVYQYRELAGMTGWAMGALQEAIVGSEHWGTNQARLAESGDMGSLRRRFWNAESGGGLLMNEFVRRFLPAERSSIEKYNPLRNTMPSWLPDKYKYGDPYTSIKMGEIRLPGRGFAKLHPELANLDYEEYPDVYKYQILADVAPLSSQFFSLKSQLYKARYSGQLSDRESRLIDKIDGYHMNRVNKLSFDAVDPNALEVPLLSKVTQTAWKSGIHTYLDAVAPAEYMIPLGFRPSSKLLGHHRSAIERYEAEELYGTPMAFWNKPLRDWLRPAFYTALPIESKPVHIEHAEYVDEYFDKLEFIKYMNLIQQNEINGQRGNNFNYKWLASRTRAGVNPQGNSLSLYWSMPDSQRAYFDAFALANEKEREKIKNMVPEDTVRLYESIWSRVDSNDPSLYSHSSDIDMNYMNEKYSQVASDVEAIGMPGPNWIGWDPAVSINDIKVRYVERLGKDLHDYDLWESDYIRSQQQPFLENSEEPFYNNGWDRMSLIRRDAHRNFGKDIFSFQSQTAPSYLLTYDDDRMGDIGIAFREYLQ